MTIDMYLCLPITMFIQSITEKEDRIRRRKPKNLKDLETLSDIHFQVSLLIKEIVQERLFTKSPKL